MLWVIGFLRENTTRRFAKGCYRLGCGIFINAAKAYVSLRTPAVLMLRKFTKKVTTLEFMIVSNHFIL
jgi:hypothetical protein